MAKIDEVLNKLDKINIKLYGEGEFEGDIPEIKKHLIELNKVVSRDRELVSIHNSTLYGHGNDPGLVNQVEQTKNRLWKLAIIVTGISASVGGGVAGLINFLS